jgi:hypothetical protein
MPQKKTEAEKLRVENGQLEAIEERDNLIKEYESSVETSIQMSIKEYLDEFLRLSDIETFLLIGQVAYDFEDKVRKNNNLDSSVYFHNLTPDVQNLYNDYLILRTTILDLKNCITLW